VQSYLQMHFFFMDQLHKQEFTLHLTNVPLNISQAHLCSCASPTIGAWLLVHLNTPSFHLSSAHFLIALCIHLSIPHPTIAHFSRCQCDHTINDLGIHLLDCPCGSECTTTHDMLQDIIAIITSDSGTHI